MKFTKCLTPVLLTISLAYLAYLGLIVEPLYFHDALGYKDSVTVILEKGLWAYFQSDIGREPLYILLMSVAQFLLPFDYTINLKILHIILNLSGLLILLRILKDLKITSWIVVIIGLMYIFSPSLINATFASLSEIAVVPIILMTVYYFKRCFAHLLNSNFKACIKSGLILGILFLFIVSVKGAFEAITPLILIAIFFFGLIRLPRPHYKRLSLLLICAVLSFYIPLNIYKGVNLALHDEFTFTNRGPWALYGNTARRTQNISNQSLKAAAFYAVDKNFCIKKMSSTDCQYWDYHVSDMLGQQENQRLNSLNLNKNQINQSMVSSSLKLIFHNPIQYAYLWTVELSKILFWESTHHGFVVYPSWLENIYRSHTLLFYLYVFIPVLSVLSIFIGLFTLSRELNHPYSSKDIQIFAALIIVVMFGSIHAFFLVLPRYTIPLGPIFLVLIASMLNGLFIRKHTQPSKKMV